MEEGNTLNDFKPGHEYFIGIDSDGCVFDSMEVKQKEFFIPIALRCFSLYAIPSILRKTWEFVNLYSIYRGGNRFISIIKVFELLHADERVKSSGVVLPGIKALKEWTLKESKLGNESLRKYLSGNPDPELERVLFWSETVNEEMARWLKDVPPFPAAIRAVESLSASADLVIVSQTPLEALEREWRENDLEKYVKAIAGQEHGTKSWHLSQATSGKYNAERILMIGDAAGDLQAAEKNGIFFYPVIPGKENESWERFMAEGSARFFNGTFAGKYQEELKDEFRKSLPDKMP